MTELPKTFDPAAIEARWYPWWEERGLFRPERPDAEPFTIVNPPPNVTGSLHIGHALDNTLQDILVRHARLKGRDALWVVGTDHAGIATQMVVERQLMERQQKRTDFTREEFVAKVWEWKEESGGEITRQLRRLGCSMDWSREQFTMDPHFVRAVTRVFVDLYEEGLIYRDKRLVNWDPGLRTAISDLEVENAEIQGHFWHFSYPLEGGSGAISVATTRPETMLADMAVAVHPDDARYRDIVGRKVKLPITGRLVPVIADEHADPELGSGAVKITPGHDFDDFEVGKRAGIAPADMLNMFDAEARVVQTADGLIPEALIGLDRFEARKKVVEMIEKEQGKPVEVEERTVTTPFGDRSNAVIEPWLTDQWYVDAEKLAQKPIQAVRDGDIRIVPKSWEKTFFNWMENIQPWCISRQLWWGHRIPAWYDEEGRVFVAEDEASARAQAGEGASLRQDEDVLDTWFSSALWPFATLGWPQSSPSPDGEGDHAKHGGGVSYFPSPDGEGDHAKHGGGVRRIEGHTPPPPAAVPLPGKAGEDMHRPYKLPPKTNEAVVRAKALRRNMPPSEAKLWRKLKDRPGGLKFRRQHPAGDFVLDFFCPAAALAIEVDGEAHDRGDRPQRDEARDNFLRECGVETLRIPARKVLDDVEAVVAAIVEKTKERIPLHQPAAGPPPRRAGEDMLDRHYPNDVLISGFDILFFWDARMMMQGLHFMGEVPFRTLYLHGLVRDAEGRKMSKTLGNTVDPLGLIDRYGADALRFTLAAMESQGRDIKLDETRIAGYRNFATKLWNAARFAQANGIGASQAIAPPEAELSVNRWIIGETIAAVQALDLAFAEYRFDEAANGLYHFVWDRFCDWYLELIKPVLSGVEGPVLSGVEGPVLSESSPSSDGEGDHAKHGGGVPSSPSSAGEETRAVAGWALDQILVMLHPFMPFVTEELWHALASPARPRPYPLIVAKWPSVDTGVVDAEAKKATEYAIELITKIRSARSEVNVPPAARPTMLVTERSKEAEELLYYYWPAIKRLGRVDLVMTTDVGPFPGQTRMPSVDQSIERRHARKGVQIPLPGFLAILELEGVIDLEAEKSRLEKSAAAAEKERDSLARRLANPQFLEKAKPQAVDKARADHAEKSAEAEKYRAALERLESA
ncbi:MAG: valine--tRNA ligase [Sphingomonadaceae bacterium]